MRSVSFCSCAASIELRRVSPFIFPPNASSNTKGGLNRIQSTPPIRPLPLSAFQTVQPFLKTVCMGSLCLRQRLKPFCQLLEAFVARRFGHSRIHLGVLIRLTFNGRLKVGFRIANRYSGCRIPHFLQKVQVAEGMTRFRLGGIAKETAHIWIPFDVRPSSEIEVAAVCL